jgi:hypothetical protein
MKSGNYAYIWKAPGTALRDITDLVVRGVLRKSDAGGHSTSYELNDSGDSLPPVTSTK